MESRFSNELLQEKSMYLLQHAHNPVNWYSWNEKSLQLAKDQHKIILLSIGYASCHWCHVMERESFEDEGVAAFMNEHFINIKVDREERPDLDHLYMEAVQLITGSGGWPLNVFLTPDAKPFYGGTYFPPQPLYNRISWMQALQSIAKIWKEDPAKIELQATHLLNHIQANLDLPVIKNSISNHQKEFDQQFCEDIAVEILKTADTANGGFGKAPKFPQFSVLQYLLGVGYLFNHKASLQQAKISIHALIDGGIYDHLAGGISRYSTDEEWLVPHFEKMLYDNALLVMVLSEAYQIYQDSSIKDCILKTINFCNTELKSKEGAFFSSIDADSEGEEGKFYVWIKTEIEEVLGSEAGLFCECYQVSEEGNWEGKNILHKKRSWPEIAINRGIEEKLLTEKMNAAAKQLLNKRNQRIKPETDDKIILSWNALMVTAFSKAAVALDSEWLREEATQLYSVLKSIFLEADHLHYHSFCKGVLKQRAFLDDYAFFIQAAIQLYEMTGEETYLEDAMKFTNRVRSDFKQENKGFYFFTAFQQQDIKIRKPEWFDGATPSANSIMLENCYYLSRLMNIKEWQSEADQSLFQLKDIVAKLPHSLGSFAFSMLKRAKGMNEIMVTGFEIQEMVAGINKLYLPNKIFSHGIKPSQLPLLKNCNYQKAFTIQLCRGFSCNDSIKNLEDFKRVI